MPYIIEGCVQWSSQNIRHHIVITLSDPRRKSGVRDNRKGV